MQLEEIRQKSDKDLQWVPNVWCVNVLKEMLDQKLIAGTKLTHAVQVRHKFFHTSRSLNNCIHKTNLHYPDDCLFVCVLDVRAYCYLLDEMNRIDLKNNTLQSLVWVNFPLAYTQVKSNSQSKDNYYSLIVSFNYNILGRPCHDVHILCVPSLRQPVHMS